MPLDRDEYIRLRAYDLWNQQGQPAGHEKEHWSQASAEFDARPRLWRLKPVAELNDDRWLGGPVWKEVIVSATTSGQARYLASQWEAARLGHHPTEDTAGNTAMSYSSALADPVLYVMEEVEGDASEDLGVVGEPQIERWPPGKGMD